MPVRGTKKFRAQKGEIDGFNKIPTQYTTFTQNQIGIKQIKKVIENQISQIPNLLPEEFELPSTPW